MTSATGQSLPNNSHATQESLDTIYSFHPVGTFCYPVGELIKTASDRPAAEAQAYI